MKTWAKLPSEQVHAVKERFLQINFQINHAANILQTYFPDGQTNVIDVYFFTCSVVPFYLYTQKSCLSFVQTFNSLCNMTSVMSDILGVTVSLFYFL
jgi:hypothetical protein